MNTASTISMGSSAVGGGGEFAAGDYSQIFEWVSQLLKGPEGREKALLELSRKREQYDDLALILWHSFGTLLLRCLADWPM
jgi:CCR4-NOT transcription complex subunit 9